MRRLMHGLHKNGRRLTTSRQQLVTYLCRQGRVHLQASQVGSGAVNILSEGRSSTATAAARSPREGEREAGVGTLLVAPVHVDEEGVVDLLNAGAGTVGFSSDQHSCNTLACLFGYVREAQVFQNTTGAAAAGTFLQGRGEKLREAELRVLFGVAWAEFLKRRTLKSMSHLYILGSGHSEQMKCPGRTHLAALEVLLDVADPFVVVLLSHLRHRFVVEISEKEDLRSLAKVPLVEFERLVAADLAVDRRHLVRLCKVVWVDTFVLDELQKVHQCKSTNLRKGEAAELASEAVSFSLM